GLLAMGISPGWGARSAAMGCGSGSVRYVGVWRSSPYHQETIVAATADSHPGFGKSPGFPEVVVIRSIRHDLDQVKGGGGVIRSARCSRPLARGPKTEPVAPKTLPRRIEGNPRLNLMRIGLEAGGPGALLGRSGDAVSPAAAPGLAPFASL